MTDITGPKVQIGKKWVGRGEPVFVIAEIGINHNGSLDLAKQLIDGAAMAGCDAVKFQKRTPELCVPADQCNIMRDTPWGRMSYIDYRRKVEFGWKEYAEIDQYCREKGILWFSSCWDEEAVDFMERFDPPGYKAASLTDVELLQKMKRTGRPLIMSTGMSSMAETEAAVGAVGRDHLLVAHSTSAYPCPVSDLNLRMLHTLMDLYAECPIGYSVHETGLAPTWAAVALGAQLFERHITLDRAMWGTDQAASIEMPGLMRLVTQIRDVEAAMGNGIKRVTEAEEQVKKKLRRKQTLPVGQLAS